MNEKMHELMERRETLLARITNQREQMAEIGSNLRTPLSLADRGMAIAHYLRYQPLLFALVATFFVFRRRSVAGLVWGGLSVWKMYRDFTSLTAKR
jgi:hypothetical protein